MRKNKRALKVCEQSGYRYKPTPALMLKGAWLEEWGFTFNMPVSVQCEEGRLISRQWRQQILLIHLSNSNWHVSGRGERSVLIYG